MADQDTTFPYLHLVKDVPQADKRGPKHKTGLEPALSREPDVLGLCYVAPPSMRLFAKTIDTARPRYIFDLRVLPAFEGAGMSRRALFRIMESTGCTYVDVMGVMGGKEWRDKLLPSGAFEECVRSVCGHELVGPMYFLFESREVLAWSCSALPKALNPAPPYGWSVYVLGLGASVNEQLSVERADAFMADAVQPWSTGEVLYVVASPSEATGWLLDDRDRPSEPVNLRRGSSVRVVAVQIGQWTDVLVLGGPHQGSKLRLASNAHVARLVK